MSTIAIVSGSTNSISRLKGLTDYVAQCFTGLGYEVNHVVVAELPPEDLILANFNGAEIKEALAKIEKADVVVFASPVYKASYTGVLKTFLDLIPQKGLQRKVVLPLFIGGTIAHLLSIDYALKPVLAVLGATHILTGVYALDSWVAKTDNGGFELNEEVTERLDASLEQLREELDWRRVRNSEKL